MTRLAARTPAGALRGFGLGLALQILGQLWDLRWHATHPGVLETPTAAGWPTPSSATPDGRPVVLLHGTPGCRAGTTYLPSGREKEGPVMMWGWQGWSWWGWLAMSLSMVALWGLIVWGAVAVVRGSGGSWRRPEGRDPEQILAERYATGGMDEEEYHRRLQTLRSARDGVGEPQRQS